MYDDKSIIGLQFYYKLSDCREIEGHASVGTDLTNLKQEFLTLDNDEHIREIFGSADNVIYFIGFKTNKNRII